MAGVQNQNESSNSTYVEEHSENSTSGNQTDPHRRRHHHGQMNQTEQFNRTLPFPPNQTDRWRQQHHGAQIRNGTQIHNSTSQSENLLASSNDNYGKLSQPRNFPVALVAGLVGGFGFLIILLVIICCCCCKKKKQTPKSNSVSDKQLNVNAAESAQNVQQPHNMNYHENIKNVHPQYLQYQKGYPTKDNVREQDLAPHYNNNNFNYPQI